MRNKYLERELTNNFSEHEIFENIEEKDMEETKRKIKCLPFANILVEFDMEKIKNSKLLNMYPQGSEESIKIWDRFVAIQIWKSFHKKEENEQENIILNGTEEEYLNNEETLPNSDGFKLWTSIVNMVVRVHFVIKDCKNKDLYNAVCSYLDDKIHATMIYCDSAFVCKVKQDEYQEKQWLWNIYDYKIFDGFNEGMESAKIRARKILPDKPKQMVKTYEKI